MGFDGTMYLRERIQEDSALRAESRHEDSVPSAPPSFPLPPICGCAVWAYFALWFIAAILDRGVRK